MSYKIPAAMKNWSRVKSRCPEETTHLTQAIQALP